MNGVTTLQDIVRKTTDLPSIPAAALRVLEQTDSSTSTAASVADTITNDPGLSARVLRLANSAYFGMSRRVTDVSEAVVILGMTATRQLCMVAASYPWMSRPMEGYGLGPKEMWMHSFGMGVGSQLLAKKANCPNPEYVFTCGLLGDIGKVALSIWLEKKLPQLLDLASIEDCSFDEIERKVFGFDHTEVGMYLAESWNLPPIIVNAIRYHHQPNLMPDPATDCVHLADYLTTAMGFGIGGDGLRYRIYDEALGRLKLTPADLDSITDEFVSEYERYESLMKELTAA